MFLNAKGSMQDIQWMNGCSGLWRETVEGKRSEAPREWKEAESFYTSLLFVHFDEYFSKAITIWAGKGGVLTYDILTHFERRINI